MAGTEYTFHITSYDTKALAPQTAKALEQLAEFRSRQEYPKLWRVTDRLNASRKGKSKRLPVSERKKTLLWSLVNLALGVILLVPGLAGGKGSLLYLIVGIAGIAASIWGFARSKKLGKEEQNHIAKQLKEQFDTVAQEMLSVYENGAASMNLQVVFSDNGMTMRQAGTEEGQETVPYSDFECIIETVDLYQCVFGGRIMLLQKKDMYSGSHEELHDFLSVQLGDSKQLISVQT